MPEDESSEDEFGAKIRPNTGFIGKPLFVFLATLRNVPKLLFWGRNWSCKVCRYSALFGFIRLFDEVRAELV